MLPFSSASPREGWPAATFGAVAGAALLLALSAALGSDLSTTLGRVTDPGPLLLCFDGSAGAEHAIEVAAVLAPRRAAIVLTVWQPVAEFSPGNPLGAYLDAITPAAAELDEIAARHAHEQAEHGAAVARKAGLEAEPLAERGERISTRIVEIAQARDVGAVVVGSHGHSALGAQLLGSVATALTHECPRPVVVVPDPQRGVDKASQAGATAARRRSR